MSSVSEKMKQADIEFLDILKKHGFGKDLKLSENEYELFDASNDSVIIEFKRRKGAYAEYLIEMDKMGANYYYAQRTGKKFYYVVIDNIRIHRS